MRGKSNHAVVVLVEVIEQQQSAPSSGTSPVDPPAEAASKDLALKKELTAIVEKLVEDFNTADPVKYKSYFHILHAKVSKTQLERMHDENSPLFNFEKLRDSGWIKSTVNEIEVIYATEDKSLVRLYFSRINKE